MSKSNASLFKMYLVESSVDKLVCELTNITRSGTTNKIDLTTKDNNGYEDFIPGLRSGSANIEGMVDDQPVSTSRNLDDFVTAWMNRTLLTLKFTNSVSGDTVTTTLAYVTAFEETAGTETARTFTATLDFKGAPTVGTNS